MSPLGPCDRRPSGTSARRLQMLMVLLLLTPAASAAAPPRDSTGSDRAISPSVPAALELSRTKSAVRVDGRLEETAWTEAARIDRFVEVEPGENVAPPVRTVAYLTYDETHLYVAFEALESDPTSIRASVTGRDEIFSDDMVGIYLDTYGNASWAYGLFANPLGIQADSRKTPGGEDTGFDIRYRADGRLTERGFVVEMAVPFAELRYPEESPHEWNAHVFRARPRGQRRIFSWAPISRENGCMLCQAGRIEGIARISARPRTQVLPAAVGAYSGAPGEDSSRSESLHAEPSVTVNHPLGRGFRLEATVNPDFSQIESDPAQLDVNSTYALSLPERRPFFQEGGDLLRTPVNTLYTRAINDPIGAVKLTRRSADSGLLVLAARDETTPVLVPLEERSRTLKAGGSLSSIVRYRRDQGGSSYLGTTLTGRRLDEGSAGSLTVGLDGRRRFGRSYALRWQGTISRTLEPIDSTLSASIAGYRFAEPGFTSGFDGEAFTGYAGYLRAERETRRWDTELTFRTVHPAFRAPLGFVNRTAYRQIRLHQALITYPSGPLLTRIRPFVDLERSWNFDGVRKSQSVEPGLRVQLARQTYLRLGYTWMDERFGGTSFSDVQRLQAYLTSRPAPALEAGLGVRYGDMIARSEEPPRLGTGLEVQARGELRLSRRIRTRLRVQLSELRDPAAGNPVFSGLIARSHWEYQVTRDLSLRTILEYDEFGGTVRIEPLLRYEPAPFTRLYLGSSHRLDVPGSGGFTPLRRRSRDVFFKIQYGLHL